MFTETLKKFLFISFVLFLIQLILGCSPIFKLTDNEDVIASPNQDYLSGELSRMGPGHGMMDRHHSVVPEDYVGLVNPRVSDEASLARGEEIYQLHCATCHGDFGNGFGPGGVSMDPKPDPIAHTSQMMSDAYLYWRITEGGKPFGTGMISYEAILEPSERWDVINYLRALGKGDIHPQRFMGGKPFDHDEELAHRAEMLFKAVEDNFISQKEADTFDMIHTLIDKFIQQETISGFETNNGRADAIPEILNAMISQNIISREDGDIFFNVHERLIDSGLME